MRKGGLRSHALTVRKLKDNLVVSLLSIKISLRKWKKSLPSFFFFQDCVQYAVIECGLSMFFVEISMACRK